MRSIRAVEDDQPSVGQIACALVLPLCAVSSAESVVYAIIVRWMAFSDTAMFVLNHAHWVMAAIVAVTVCLVSIPNKRLVLAAAAGCAIALFGMTRFRGSYSWPGTFDHFYLDGSYWQFALLLSFLFGWGLRQIISRKMKRKTWPVCGGLLFLSILATSLDAHAVQTSEFAPTRHLALAVMGLCLAIAAGVGLIIRRNDYETRVHAH